MFDRSKFARSALAAFAGVAALTSVAAAPGVASAQPYGGYSYDPCRRDSTNRSTSGGLIGAAIGAVIGSNAAARGVRTEGALLGGAVGGVAGAVIGNRSAACREGTYTDPRSSYNDRVYDRSGGGYYDNRTYHDRYGDRHGDQRRYDRPYYEGSRYDAPRYDDYDATAVRVEDRQPSADSCTLAESPIYLPDGRVQKRFVRVCRDSAGKYQVVE